MDATKIRQLAKQVDDSLIAGNIYHILYTVRETNTDAFYDHKKELIKLLQDTIAREEADPALDPKGPDFIRRQQNREDIIKSMKRDLTQVRERNYSCDYSVDGVGFYMKQTLAHVSAEGKAGTPRTTTYVSDGKIMGTFYRGSSQGVIEPATERPRMPFAYWTEIAYQFSHDTLTSCVTVMPKLALAEDAGQLVITGERIFDGNQKTDLELRIDQATLMPARATLIFYDHQGRVHTEETKSWQYQDYAGVRLPKLVVDRYSETGLNGKLNVEKERVFTIVDFSPTPSDAKAAFAGLLKSNFSMYDEITGEHYLSGNPAQALDKLSK